MSVVHDHPGVSTLVGTPKQVQDQLRKSHADQVLALTFEHVNAGLLESLVENMSNVASSMFELFLKQQDREVVEHLAEALVPRKPASPRLLKEAMMLAQVHVDGHVSGEGDPVVARRSGNRIVRRGERVAACRGTGHAIFALTPARPHHPPSIPVHSGQTPARPAARLPATAGRSRTAAARAGRPREASVCPDRPAPWKRATP